MARKKYTGVRYARVPMGGDTCEFCMMLASRGAVYASSAAAGEMEHYHANCHCKVVPAWGLSEIEGYNPNEYYDRWKHPEKYSSEKWRYQSVGAMKSSELVKAEERIAQSELNYINWDSQDKHIAESRRYLEEMKKGHLVSVFTISREDVELLAKSAVGKGSPDFYAMGGWANTETINLGVEIGYVYDINGNREVAKDVKTHYSNIGIHLVPKILKAGEALDDIG